MANSVPKTWLRLNNVYVNDHEHVTVDVDGVTSIRQYNPAGESPDMEKSHSHEAEQACLGESRT